MSAAANTALLHRYVAEVWDGGNLDALDEFLAADYRRHRSPLGAPLDRTRQKQLLAAFRAAFPDATLTVEEVIAQDDRLAFRSTVRATHQGEILGIPATGKAVTMGLIDVWRVAEGRVLEQWGGPDMLDVVTQLGGTITPPVQSN